MQFSRPLGDSELSYFLPSRQDGVNDMYLHLGFQAPPSVVSPSRLRTVWAILRVRHPLLAAHVVMKPHDYTGAHFVCMPPASAEAALADASAAFETRSGTTKDALIDAYLNGPRTLSATNLSHLILSTPPAAPPTPPPDDVSGPAPPPAPDAPAEYDLLLCAVHFLGDGMALHACANELFLLLTSTRGDDAALSALLEKECAATQGGDGLPLPAALETRLLPSPRHAWQRVACAIEFRATQARLVGGHAFPRAAPPASGSAHGRRTIVPTVSFSKDETRAALAACKARGVSIAHAMFALCALAWTRTGGRARPDLPILMYSALNLRPYLAPAPELATHPSYWFLAVGYFNVVLPAFLSSATPDAQTFWARARAAKAQSVRAARSRLLIPRSRCMAAERAERARTFAALDDGVAPAPAPPTPRPTPPPQSQSSRAAAAAPSTALLGLSLLGNLDGTYAHDKYRAGGDLTLHTLTTGSRQRPGGLLLFAYTFAGRLWLCLGYDVVAFGGEKEKKPEGGVGGWWQAVVSGAREFLVL